MFAPTSGPHFLAYSPRSYRVFFDMFKITDSLKRRTNCDFQQLSRCLKWGFSKRKWHLGFCTLSMLEKDKHKGENTGKESYNKKQKLLFFVVSKVDYAIKAFVLFENCKTYLFFGEKRHIREDDLLWQNILSCFCGRKTQKTIHICWRGLQQAEGKSQNFPFASGG